MKSLIAVILLCSAPLPSHAADEPLIPLQLNNLLPKLHARMTIREVEEILTKAYPGVKGQKGDWSGLTGYVNYKLDERRTLSISSMDIDGKLLVHDEILLYIFDWPSKRRVDVKIFDWAKPKPVEKPSE